MSTPRPTRLVGMGGLALLLGASVLSARLVTRAGALPVSQADRATAAAAAGVRTLTSPPAALLPATQADPTVLASATARVLPRPPRPVSIASASLPSRTLALQVGTRFPASAPVSRGSADRDAGGDARAQLEHLLQPVPAAEASAQPVSSDPSAIMTPSGTTTNRAVRFLHLGSGWQGQALNAPEGDG